MTVAIAMASPDRLMPKPASIHIWVAALQIAPCAGWLEHPLLKEARVNPIENDKNPIATISLPQLAG